MHTIVAWMNTKTSFGEILMTVAFWFLWKTEKPYAQKFTKKTSQKCAFYNSALCYKITSNEYSNPFFQIGKNDETKRKIKSKRHRQKTCQNPSAFIRAKKNDFIPVSFIRIRFAKGWGWDVGQILSNCKTTDQAENLEN